MEDTAKTYIITSMNASKINQMLQKELELCHNIVDVKPTQIANRYRVLILRNEPFLTDYVYAEMISSRLKLHIQ